MNFNCIVKKIVSKDGRTFYGASIKGHALSHYWSGNNGETVLGSNAADLRKCFVSAEDNSEARYSIRPCSGEASVPQKEGIFTVSFSEGWVDSRVPEKHIIRIRGSVGFLFLRDLPAFKDGGQGQPKAADPDEKPAEVDPEDGALSN